ncbi:uncharacterized protein BXZ73DRAFT_75926 [Epithele typhae]|uniref:uncharacterized protein n=1 Tax=Epithele typhae TaxID=378194 RepID=UPI0020083DE0|nr:uncharacterized protein BXZ73DRAFT_75926 [Epithele typhae]KAH9939755.1 hypothetical protein BXZ73DRAFT_75926 [Epithele typhae]
MASLPQIPALDDTFGALVVDTFLDLILYGISLNQIYAYFDSYASEKLGLKLLKKQVATILVLETLYTVTTAHICYHYLVINYFNPANLVVSVWHNRSLNVSVFYRLQPIVNIAHNPHWLGLLYRYDSGGRADFRMGLLMNAPAATYIAWTSGSFAILTDIEWMLTCGTSLALAADTILAGMLVKVLRDSRTGITKTDTMLNVIIMYTVNTGLLTRSPLIRPHIRLRIQAVKYPHNLWNAITGFPNIRLYSNCMLAALNARKSLAERGMGVHTLISGAPSQFPMSLRGIPFLRRSVGTKTVDSSIGAQQAQYSVFGNRSLPKGGDDVSLEEGVRTPSHPTFSVVKYEN